MFETCCVKPAECRSRTPFNLPPAPHSQSPFSDSAPLYLLPIHPCMHTAVQAIGTAHPRFQFIKSDWQHARPCDCHNCRLTVLTELGGYTEESPKHAMQHARVMCSSAQFITCSAGHRGLSRAATTFCKTRAEDVNAQTRQKW